MHNHIPRIDQNPIAMGQPFNLGAFNARFLQRFGEVVRNGAHVALRTAGRDDHEVGHGSFFRDVDGRNFFSLGIFKTSEDGF